MVLVLERELDAWPISGLLRSGFANRTGSCGDARGTYRGFSDGLDIGMLSWADAFARPDAGVAINGGGSYAPGGFGVVSEESSFSTFDWSTDLTDDVLLTWGIFDEGLDADEAVTADGPCPVNGGVFGEIILDGGRVTSLEAANDNGGNISLTTSIDGGKMAGFAGGWRGGAGVTDAREGDGSLEGSCTICG